MCFCAISPFRTSNSFEAYFWPRWRFSCSEETFIETLDLFFGGLKQQERKGAFTISVTLWVLNFKYQLFFNIPDILSEPKLNDDNCKRCLRVENVNQGHCPSSSTSEVLTRVITELYGNIFCCPINSSHSTLTTSLVPSTQ